jgi:hypothetical protein
VQIDSKYFLTIGGFGRSLDKLEKLYHNHSIHVQQCGRSCFQMSLSSLRVFSAPSQQQKERQFHSVLAVKFTCRRSIFILKKVETRTLTQRCHRCVLKHFMGSCNLLLTWNDLE